jgi:hypothetical protein
MATWRLSWNLKAISDSVKAKYGNPTIYSIGDIAHQAEPSDHNPDSRGIVCAIDIMIDVSDDRSGPLFNDLLARIKHGTDIRYMIRNRKMYHRRDGFAPTPYTGSDPHTNHFHISSEHTNAADQTLLGLLPPPVQPIKRSILSMSQLYTLLNVPAGATDIRNQPIVNNTRAIATPQGVVALPYGTIIAAYNADPAAFLPIDYAELQDICRYLVSPTPQPELNDTQFAELVDQVKQAVVQSLDGSTATQKFDSK